MYPFWIVVIIVLFYLLSSIKILTEYERGVIFRLGRLLPQAKGPGVILVFKPVDRMVRVSLRIDTLEVVRRQLDLRAVLPQLSMLPKRLIVVAGGRLHDTSDVFRRQLIRLDAIW